MTLTLEKSYFLPEGVRGTNTILPREMERKITTLFSKKQQNEQKSFKNLHFLTKNAKNGTKKTRF